ncbi:hypothetical protein [Ehrlichia ruminantium]|uniref:UbiH/UbiF/VisC/COQ6 family ubiquinone biosynthesis hydroxylase n=1 Tax=Ehrlichia ruminantium TaxID=779 RepID=A0A170SAR9_EHRRU|nr:hypothetical protein [Ehrlichia ruminantium]GAT77822.1 UbiH/UbiF/VisC/COQ6 family ubiquinone biosynthesis hydroxylase [Ehrlichia ruminantium]
MHYLQDFIHKIPKRPAGLSLAQNSKIIKNMIIKYAMGVGKLN